MASDRIVIDVCAAVIIRGGALLLALRPEGKHLAAHWEFPGGKVAVGENLEDCIKREIEEELGVSILAATQVYSLEHCYPEKTVRLHFLQCSLPDSVTPMALEHDEIDWFLPCDAQELNLAPADRRFLEEWLGCSDSEQKVNQVSLVTRSPN